jgi:hypothetical protein
MILFFFDPAYPNQKIALNFRHHSMCSLVQTSTKKVTRLELRSMSTITPVATDCTIEPCDTSNEAKRLERDLFHCTWAEKLLRIKTTLFHRIHCHQRTNGGRDRATISQHQGKRLLVDRLSHLDVRSTLRLTSIPVDSRCASFTYRSYIIGGMLHTELRRMLNLC